MHDFFKFCKQNIFLICVIAFTVLLTYGFMLLNSVTGVDTEGAMSAYRTTVYSFSISTGRWGGQFLDMLWRITPYNPHLAVVCSLCFLGIGALMWHYVFISAANGFIANTPVVRNRIGAVLFYILYITSFVWNELMYFHPTTFFFSIMLCPIVILIIFRGFLLSRFWLIAGGVLCSAFLFSVYQALIPFLCSGVLICFFLLLRQSAPGILPLFLKILSTFIIAYLLYFALDYIIKFVFNVQSGTYVNNFNTWGRGGFTGSIKRILTVGYELTVVPFLRKSYNTYGSLALLPVSLMFIYVLLKNRVKYGILFVITGLCISGSIMLLPILGANRPPLRTMFSLPLVMGFTAWFLIDEWSANIRCKMRKFCITLLVLLVAAVSLYQVQVAIQVQYSDYRRYNADVRLAGILDEKITGIISKNSNVIHDENGAVPLAIFGRYEPFKFDRNFIYGEVSGHSIFYWDTQWDTIIAPSRRATRFMQSLGMNYVMPPYEQLNAAAVFAASMPVYPADGCVAVHGGIVVVRISE
ncbi:MAG: glucosyltransferase domain-containing protein [Bacteroidales bacterium]|nr:glucosyltransferase domain-containing protein [Bacteroidales bacterium]